MRTSDHGVDRQPIAFSALLFCKESERRLDSTCSGRLGSPAAPSPISF